MSLKIIICIKSKVNRFNFWYSQFIRKIIFKNIFENHVTSMVQTLLPHLIFENILNA